MKENIILILKGIIIGAGKIIPGVSGGMLAITLGVYDKGVKAISEFFRDIRIHFKFLSVIGIGILISLLVISKLIKFSLESYYLPTMLLFIGLIIGGIPSIVKEAKEDLCFKNILILVIPFIVIFCLSLGKSYHNENVSTAFLPMFGIGFIEAVTMIVPGISGTAVLMILGYYDTVITCFSNMTNFSQILSNFSILFPFVLGMFIGVLLLIRIIDVVLDRYRSSAYFAVIGFSIASILMLLGQTFSRNYDVLEIIFSLFLLVLGYFIGKRLDKIN